MQTASPGTCRRLQETLELFFQAIQQQAIDRVNKTIPDLESFITLRRDTSGCKTTWALIEYAYNLDIPDEVMDHPMIRSMGEAANDWVAASNVSPLGTPASNSRSHAHAARIIRSGYLLVR